MRRGLALGAAVLLFGWAPPSPAQEAGSEASTGDASETVAVVAMPPADEIVDVAAIALPALDFTPDPKHEKGFDKYYYFHRDGTDFPTALADLRDCDGLARGLSLPFGYSPSPYPYNDGRVAGAAGNLIANVMIVAIFGSAQVRAARRVNMRRCMSFKGYQRYGLPKDVWQEFNFEEGFSDLEEKRRQAFLKQQAKAASGDRPKTEALGR